MVIRAVREMTVDEGGDEGALCMGQGAGMACLGHD